ncbi:NADH-ubiquinone oxidoreductase-F iron-sulfur binding region domain-containing protein [Nocardioides flavescens]|uniref:NADH-ubiquinone oxidoreductase 51kDa subunit iron-sulphur binding domain-containing protein n=1 Tax=Nocardioides flavescens TaxID=2691959 RepID=A0A6L7F3K4_9ACTN|nr:NADH-ubiquinone oxidoreductase-F iron-sulfur binding region domain-containing protein [Nocardioides flavescens]MXG91819.1 hypothetical protein [Nocardioides flavescens]
MSALAASGTAPGGTTGTVRAWGTARLLAGTGSRRRVDLARHRSVHAPLRSYDAAGLAEAAEAVRLLGRGGAAFPVAVKLRSVAPGPRAQVLVNGSEGEPASGKDRALLRLVPHLVLDGAVLVARALGTGRVTVAVSDAEAHASLDAALHERPDRGSFRLQRHDHGFVGGEVRALARAVSGGPALPPGRRVLPTVQGVDGDPTFASNAETFAQLALLAELGPAAYASVGCAEEPGTTLVTLLGDVPHAGVVEVPTGLPLRALLGEGTGPVLVGGYHGTWLADPSDLVLSRPALRAAGVSLGAAVLARLPHDTCALGEASAVAHWLASESAGQCGPCVFGLPALAAGLDDLARGGDAVACLRSRAAPLPGRGACAHPDGAARFVASALEVLAATGELEVHRRQGQCGRPLRYTLPVVAR